MDSRLLRECQKESVIKNIKFQIITINNVKVETTTVSVTLNKYISYSMVVFSFAVPFFFSNYQILTGSFVNALLFVSASKTDNKYTLPIIILPSLAVLSRGLIFGPFTKFLIFFIPFLWISNLILVFVFRKFNLKNYPARIIVAASLKTAFLFAVANLYFSWNLIPRMFLQTMGILQFVTAIIGGGVVYPIYLSFQRRLES